MSHYQTSLGLTVTTIESRILESPVYSVTDPMNMIFPYNIGNSLWSASIDLIEYIETQTDWINKSKTQKNKINIIELGAGCGSVGMVLWKHGFKVTLTDINEMIPIMNENIQYNQLSEKVDNIKTLYDNHEEFRKICDDTTNDPNLSIQAECLDWCQYSTASHIYETKGPFNYIIAAEISYDDDLHHDFIETLLILCGLSDDKNHPWNHDDNDDKILFLENVRILIAIPHRDNDEELINHAIAKGFTCKIVKLIEPNQQHSSCIAIYELIPPFNNIHINKKSKTLIKVSKRREDIEIDEINIKRTKNDK
mmetsp:Transcript_52777/g.67668  ORF Transcript_52777/g.67668 Transcript_52777/m.67668 type:complete len:309 (+) Transcript_52777:130-1056(+)